MDNKTIQYHTREINKHFMDMPEPAGEPFEERFHPATQKFFRQECIDSNFVEAVSQGFTLLQPKFDGIWCACRIVKYTEETILCEYYSRNNNLKHKAVVKSHQAFQFVEPLVLLGELMYGTERAAKYPANSMVVFDIWSNGTADYRREDYTTRYRKILEVLMKLPKALFAVCPTYPITQFATFWQNYVESGTFEGVVYRKPLTQTYYDSILREKLLATDDYIVMDFIEGEGRLKGTLGAISAVHKLDRTLETTIGGGLSDELRNEIWQNKERYRGKVMEIVGSGKFDSGLLRHPRFVRWHGEE